MGAGFSAGFRQAIEGKGFFLSGFRPPPQFIPFSGPSAPFHASAAMKKIRKIL
jgi:hypothetical protein